MPLSEHGPYQDATHLDSIILVQGGVIRFDSWYNGPRPKVHANTSHISTGIEKVSINSNGELEIKRDNAYPVVTCGINMDESLAQDITAGPSGGGYLTRYKFYRNGARLNLNTKAHYDHVSGSVNNAWVWWVNMVYRGTGADSISDRLTAAEAEIRRLSAIVESLGK